MLADGFRETFDRVPAGVCFYSQVWCGDWGWHYIPNGLYRTKKTAVRAAKRISAKNNERIRIIKTRVVEVYDTGIPSGDS